MLTQCFFENLDLVRRVLFDRIIVGKGAMAIGRVELL